MTRTFTATYEQHGGWWIGTVAEVPGAISQEHTLEETRASLVEAVQLILEVNQAYATPEQPDVHIVREPLTVPVPV